MKVLLTGATGFLGSHVLAELLRNQIDVRAMKRESSRLDLVENIADGAEWITGDITDQVFLEDSLVGISHIIHCAAIVSFQPGGEKVMNAINVEATANLINLALDSGVQKFVYTSSIAALGRTKDNSHISEKTKWENNPLNSRYAISKYQAEQEVWRGYAEGLPVAILNPSMIIGPGRAGENTSRFFSQIQKGLRFYPTGSTGFVDVRDVAVLLVRLLKSDVEGQRIIANGSNCSYKFIFDTIASVMGVKPPHIPAYRWLTRIAWVAEWIKSKITGTAPLLTRETARSSTNVFTYNNEKSLSLFPDFKYTPLEKTIHDTVQYFNQP